MKKQTQQEQLNAQEKQFGTQESQEMLAHARDSECSEAKPLFITFTFFMRDDSIYEEHAISKEEAFRQLCKRLGYSWGYRHGEMLECLAPDEKSKLPPSAAQLSIQLDAARLRIAHLEKALKAIARGTHCDNDGRGCYNEELAQEALNK